jgi:hypothetical protein
MLRKVMGFSPGGEQRREQRVLKPQVDELDNRGGVDPSGSA